MITQIFAVIAPIFICAGIGFAWVKRGLPYEPAFVTKLVMVVGFPCLIFSSLVQSELDLNALAEMALAAVVTLSVFAIIAYPLLRLAGQDIRAFLPPMILANTGNMGLPLCLLAFGDTGLALGIGYFTINGLLAFIVGPAIVSGSTNPMEVLKLPLIWATVLALIFKIGDVPVPEWALNTLSIIGGFPIPLMLITLGTSLAELRITTLGRSTALALLRLTMGFAVGVGVAHGLGLEGVARGGVIVECAMPAAVFNYLFAHSYNRRPAEVAGVVVISTALSFATLPALIWYVLPG